MKSRMVLELELKREDHCRIFIPRILFLGEWYCINGSISKCGHGTTKWLTHLKYQKNEPNNIGKIIIQLKCTNCSLHTPTHQHTDRYGSDSSSKWIESISKTEFCIRIEFFQFQRSIKTSNSLWQNYPKVLQQFLQFNCHQYKTDFIFSHFAFI